MSPTARHLPVLKDAELTLRPSTPVDVVPVHTILQDPKVAAWWGENSEADVALELDGAFTIEVDGAVASILECHEETEPMYPSVAFDIALKTNLHGRQIGRRALRLAVDHFITLGHHRFTIDPTVTNQA